MTFARTEPMKADGNQWRFIGNVALEAPSSGAQTLVGDEDFSSRSLQDALSKRLEAVRDTPLELSRSGQLRGGVFISESTFRPDAFVPLESWEGIVVGTTDHTFTARLASLRSDLPDEFVEIEMDELSSSDRVDIDNGDVFYWQIGYATTPGGQKTRESAIRFRRLSRWNRRDIARASKQAEAIAEDLDWR